MRRLAEKRSGFTVQFVGRAALTSSQRYGSLGAGYIEAHCLMPMASLQEGVPIVYNVATDFAVLCSNCHRMIHRSGAPADVVGLRAIIEGPVGRARR